MKQEKTAEQKQKITFIETGRIELNIRVPNLSAENAELIVRDLRFSLENSAKLLLLDEFVIARSMEYIEETE